jgi:hypothetical protein
MTVSRPSRAVRGMSQAQDVHRDSLELASLASSDEDASRRNSATSSASGTPSSRKLSLDDEDPIASPIAGRARSERHSRNFSISSAFDFVPAAGTTGGYTSLGASYDPNSATDGQSLEKNKTLTYLNGLSIVIGLIIGSGIFSSPSSVNANAGSPGASLIVWTVAGLLAWTGASSYAELGCAMPLNGGAQAYLTHIFGELAGFLYSWCCVCVLKPGSAAIIAIIMGEYVLRAITGADAAEVSLLASKGIAIGGLVLVTGLNTISTRLAARSADFFLFFKFFALAGVAVVGLIVAVTGYSREGDASLDWRTKGWFEGTNTDMSNLAVALYGGLWAFDGWDNVSMLNQGYIQQSDLSPGQLRRRRTHKSSTGLISHCSHYLPTCHLLIPSYQYGLLSCATTFSLLHERDYCCGIWLPGPRRYRCAHLLHTGIGLMFWSIECDNIH